MSTSHVEGLSVPKRLHELVEAFERSAEHVTQIRGDLARAESTFANDQTALAKWLIPKGATVGEQFNVWYGNRLISVVAGSERVSIGRARADV